MTADRVSYSAVQPQAQTPLSGEAFWRQWHSTASVTWSGIPLRTALESLARQWNVAIFLDRRIDPDQPIEFQATDQPLGTLIEQMAAKLGISVALVDAVIYFAPPGVASRVATIAEMRWDEAQRNGWTSLIARRELEWPWLTEPRRLVIAVAAGASWQVLEPERIEHDLWAANRLPAIAVTHQLSLLLAGFDLSFEPDAATRHIKLVPLPANPVLVREYAVGRVSPQRRAKLAADYPEVQWQWSANRVRVSGSAYDHYRIRRELLGMDARPTVPASTQTRYTLRTVNRFEPLARAIAERLGLELEIDPRVAQFSNRAVTINVENVTREQLIQALVDSVGWQYELSGNRLLLFPKPQP